MASPATIRPPGLRWGDTIGLVSPSLQGHKTLSEKYEQGKRCLQKLGFKLLEGKSMRVEGDPNPRQRAEDLHDMWHNEQVRLVLCSIGGMTSGSLLPYLDWDLFRSRPRFLCGFSDISALHAGLYRRTGVSSLYGPAVIAGFGEMPEMPAYSLEHFLLQCGLTQARFPLRIHPPEKWTREFVDATQPNWQEQQKTWLPNPGWVPLRKGVTEGLLFVFNQNTLLSLAGTPFFPDLEDSILVLEQVAVHPENEERQLNQLRMMGVFRKLKGLIVSKPEHLLGGMTDELYLEMLKDFADLKEGTPLVVNFDSGHTLPMLTLPQGIPFRLEVGGEVLLEQQEPAFS